MKAKFSLISAGIAGLFVLASAMGASAKVIDFVDGKFISQQYTDDTQEDLVGVWRESGYLVEFLYEGIYAEDDENFPLTGNSLRLMSDCGGGCNGLVRSLTFRRPGDRTFSLRDVSISSTFSSFYGQYWFTPLNSENRLDYSAVQFFDDFAIVHDNLIFRGVRDDGTVVDATKSSFDAGRFFQESDVTRVFENASESLPLTQSILDSFSQLSSFEIYYDGGVQSWQERFASSLSSGFVPKMLSDLPSYCFDALVQSSNCYVAGQGLYTIGWDFAWNGQNYSDSVTVLKSVSLDPTPIPVPASGLLLGGVVMVGAGIAHRRKRKQRVG